MKKMIVYIVIFMSGYCVNYLIINKKHNDEVARLRATMKDRIDAIGRLEGNLAAERIKNKNGKKNKSNR